MSQAEGVSPARTATTDRRLHEMPLHRQRQQRENAKRVQRHKAEKKFTAGVKEKRVLKLSEFQQMQDEEIKKLEMSPVERSPPRLLKPKKVEPEVDPVKVVHEFSGSIRCLELTQGGATIWTGDNDGTISIRNGMTGEIVHHIPASGGLYVDSLYATDTHMWVGLNDGTVRIYDHLVYIIVSEAQFHKSSVTSFTSTFDGKVFSASSEGAIVKWDTEANSFAMLTVIVANPNGDMIRCLACYGYNLFFAGDDSVIRCMDTEAGSGHEYREFVGHEDAVNCLMVQDGYLFSGSKDNTIRVWNMEHGDCIWTFGQQGGPHHEAAVTSFIGDTVAHRFWSADSTGVMHVWESEPENDFKHVMQLKGHEGPPIIALKSFCTIDAIKLWSLAANGKNRVWYSSVNRMEDAVQSTIDAMENIIDQDLRELAKWKELIDRLNKIDERRKQELAAAMENTSTQALARAYLHRLARWMNVSRQRRLREKVTDMLSDGDARRVLFMYYQKFERFYNEQKDRRRKIAMMRGLQATNRRSLQMLYWKKMRCFALVTKQQIKSKEVAASLETQAQHALCRKVMRQWRLFADHCARAARRKQCAENLKRLTEKTQLQDTYFMLRHYRLFRAKMARKERAASALMATTDYMMRLRWFRTLVNFQKLRKRQRRCREVHILVVEEKARRKVFGVYFNKLRGYLQAVKKQKVREEIKEEEQKFEALTAEYQAKEVVLQRLKLLEEKRKQINAAKDARAAAEKRRANAEEEYNKLLRLLSEKDGEKEKEVVRTKNEQVEDLMAKLKAKCLNYHLDYALIQKTRDQAAGTRIQGLFLENHLTIKRVVMEVTKCKQPEGERWRNLDEKLDQIPDHHKSTILHAIKTMIVCYDLMSTELKDSLETDDEILANTDYLEMMVNIAVKHRDAKFGRGAYRVRG